MRSSFSVDVKATPTISRPSRNALVHVTVSHWDKYDECYIVSIPLPLLFASLFLLFLFVFVSRSLSLSQCVSACSFVCLVLYVIHTAHTYTHIHTTLTNMYTFNNACHITVANVQCKGLQCPPLTCPDPELPDPDNGICCGSCPKGKTITTF